MEIKVSFNADKRREYGRVGVLLGGPSSEREVSLKSGKAVCDSLTQAGLEVVPIDIVTDAVNENMRLIKMHKIDCAFLALHGRFGEDGQVQEILDILGIPYTGSGAKASKLAMDKIASRMLFDIHGLEVPRYRVLEKVCRNSAANVCSEFSFPLVVKPASQGSSVGLSIIDKKEELKRAVDEALAFEDKIIIEEYIRGREVTCGILNEKPLPVIEIVPKKRFFDYEAKYQYGMTEYIVPAEVSVEISSLVQKRALMAHKILGCVGCSRVDLIINDKNQAYILEVNTIPGLTQTSLLPKAAKVCGIDFTQLCITLLDLAYEKAQVQCPA